MPHDRLHVSLREDSEQDDGKVADVAQPVEQRAGHVEEDEAQQKRHQAVRIQQLPRPADYPERGRLQGGHLKLASFFHHHLRSEAILVIGYKMFETRATLFLPGKAPLEAREIHACICSTKRN